MGIEPRRIASPSITDRLLKNNNWLWNTSKLSSQGILVSLCLEFDAPMLHHTQEKPRPKGKIGCPPVAIIQCTIALSPHAHFDPFWNQSYCWLVVAGDESEGRWGQAELKVPRPKHAGPVRRRHTTRHKADRVPLTFSTNGSIFVNFSI